MTIEYKHRNWFDKFANAFRGIVKGTHGQSSFLVHLPIAVVVIAVSLVLELDEIRFSILLMCIAAVIAAELFNSSIERLARAVSRQYDQDIGDALNIASGAVLVVAILSLVIGVIVLLGPLDGFFNGC